MSVIKCVHFILILFLTSSSEAVIAPSTFVSDAAEITSLNVALLRSSPAIFHQSQSIICEMINKCCPFIKPRLADYIDDTFASGKVLVTACTNKEPPQSFLNTCPTLSKLVAVVEDENFSKYINAVNTAPIENQSPNIAIPQTCSSDEAYAKLCDWTEQHKLESCERKRLTYVAEHTDGNGYQTFVRENKKNLRVLINAINKAFPSSAIQITNAPSVSARITTTPSVSAQITNASSASEQTTARLFITLLTLLLSGVFH